MMDNANEALLNELLQQLAHSVEKDSLVAHESKGVVSATTTANQNDPTPNELVLTIEEQFSAQDVMKRISNFLLTENEDNHISSKEAFRVMVQLATADTSRYLKPASCAVRDEARRLQGSTATVVIPDGLLPMLVEQMKSPDVLVAENSIETLVSLCKTCSAAVETILSLVCAQLQEARASLSMHRTEASLLCVRCLTALVNIACIGSPSMLLADEGLVNLLDLLQDDSDPLLQMSMLELIEKLAETEPIHQERVEWVYEHAHHVVKLAGGVVGTPPDVMLGGFALKVVATFCKLLRSHRSQDNVLIESFLAALRNNVEVGDIDRMAFVVAIASLASSSDIALRKVMDDDVTRRAWLDMSVSQPKIKAAILVSVADVIEEKSISRELAMKLFTLLGKPGGSDATDTLLNLTRSPLVEVRVSAYALFRAVADCLPTGSQVLLSHNGFFEMLMDRGNETAKNGREARYEIVKAIVESPVASLLADDIVQRMKEFLHQGPHYVKPIRWDVMEQ